mgnify:CR=1 FL=1|jgi:hypothetical protein|tara:strand:+ start:373 stop:540 length:168 start_codon:yes stop_codon:yes gene_type:complete
MKRQFVSTKGDTWEWEETPETAEALKKLHAPKFAGNYEGPLYAPHPELKRPNNPQ